jgi:hypothetical protein
MRVGEERCVHDYYGKTEGKGYFVELTMDGNIL